MDKMNSKNIRQLVLGAKTVPVAIYQLGCMNFILFVGLVIRQLPILYLLGSFVFITLLVSAISVNFKLDLVPEQLFTENIKFSLNELQNKYQSLMKSINVKKLESNSINTVITILMIVYLGSILNVTLQTFLIFNFVFLSIFMPKQLEGCIGVIKQQTNQILFKIKYKK